MHTWCVKAGRWIGLPGAIRRSTDRVAKATELQILTAMEAGSLRRWCYRAGSSCGLPVSQVAPLCVSVLLSSSCENTHWTRATLVTPFSLGTLCLSAATFRGARVRTSTCRSGAGLSPGQRVSRFRLLEGQSGSAFPDAACTPWHSVVLEAWSRRAASG